MSPSLSGRRVVVVGASAGVGRAVALAAVRSGAEVALVARRRDRLEAAVAEAGGGTAIAADVRDPAGCAEAVARVGAVLGAVDTLCYCAGTAPLALLADTDAADWQRVLETNVIGANQVIRAAMDHLTPSALVMALSSEVAAQPRTGLGAYGASKAALRASLAGWRAEQPGRRFCCVALGPTAPTEFGDQFDGSLLGALLEDWARRGLAQEEMMRTDDVAGVLVATMAALLDHPQVGMDELVLRSPSAVVGSAGSIAASFEALAGDAPAPRRP